MPKEKLTPTDWLNGPCQGDCDEHAGELAVVHVGGERDWGEFRYCETAVADDRIRGFTVTPIEAKP